MPGKYYRHSGKFTLVGAVGTLLIGLLGAFLLSWVYGYVMDWNPFVYVSVMGVAVYGLLLGSCVAIGLQVGKVRNTPIALLLTLLVALAGIYGAWVAWLFALSDQEAFLTAPSDLLAAARALAQTGVWSIFGNTPTESALYGFWLTEAFLILVCALVATYFFMTGNAFCETCQQWLEPAETLKVFQAPESYREIQGELELERLDVLGRLQPVPEGSAVFAELSAESCGRCKALHLLTLKETTRTTDDEGKESDVSKDVFERLVISQATLDRIAVGGASQG